MRYVSVETFSAHLLEGTNAIFSIKQTLLCQETHFGEKYVFYISKQTFSNSKLVFIFFFKIVIVFVLVVMGHCRAFCAVCLGIMLGAVR